MAEKNEAESKSAEADSTTKRTIHVDVDVDGAVTSYANFCRVTGTPEEMIIDVGLNSQPVGPPPDSISINQRLVMNYYTAKPPSEFWKPMCKNVFSHRRGLRVKNRHPLRAVSGEA